MWCAVSWQATEMALVPSICWLSGRDRQRIVEEAMRILDRIGVFVENGEALRLLEQAGARVDRQASRACLPPELVCRALETAPKRVLVYDRYGNVAMDLAERRLHFNPGSAALRILDHGSKRARRPVTADLIRFARLTDALDNFAAQSTGLVPSDVPERIADRYRLYIALRHSSKPVVTGTFAVEAFQPMQRMLAAVAGGEEQLRQRPIAIFDCCPSPPLRWSNLTAQALLDCARSGIPAELVSMPLSGATAPVTLAGSVTQHCAENLSGVVLHQLASPGAPIIWGGSPAFFDMRTGTTPMGAIETMMIVGAYTEIGQHLGLPTHAYMSLSDSKVLDYQAGAESAMGAVIAAASGINNVSGPGMLEFESCQSLEKLVLDHEFCGMALRLARGIDTSEELIAVPVIEQGLQRGVFLELEHTLRWFRAEAYYPHHVIDRWDRAAWEVNGHDAAGRAAERVAELLKRHQPEPLPEQTGRTLRELMEQEARRAGLQQLPEERLPPG